MNPERFVNKKHEQAVVHNEQVEEFFVDHPRSRKSPDTVAHDIIKSEASLIPYNRIPEEHRDWFQNMRDAGVRVLEDGFLEISRWDNTGAHAAKPRLITQKVDGLYSAIRMQNHILEGYRSEDTQAEDEYTKLESIQEVIESANDLLNQWKTVDLQGRKDLQLELAEIVLQLERCRNEFKIDAREQTKEVMKLKDSRGRDNPGALAARTVAALNDLTRRMNQMQLITPLIALRKEILVLEERRAAGMLRKASARLQGVLHHSVFAEKRNTAPENRIKDYEIEALDRKLGQAINALDSIYIAPHHQQAEQVKFALNHLKKFFRSKADLIGNLPAIREGLADIQDLLGTPVEHFG